MTLEQGSCDVAESVLSNVWDYQSEDLDMAKPGLRELGHVRKQFNDLPSRCRTDRTSSLTPAGVAKTKLVRLCAVQQRLDGCVASARNGKVSNVIEVVSELPVQLLILLGGRLPEQEGI